MADEREQKPADADGDQAAAGDDDAVAIPLDPVTALRALLRVDPESKPVAARAVDQDADDGR